MSIPTSREIVVDFERLEALEARVAALEALAAPAGRGTEAKTPAPKK